MKYITIICFTFLSACSLHKPINQVHKKVKASLKSRVMALDHDSHLYEVISALKLPSFSENLVDDKKVLHYEDSNYKCHIYFEANELKKRFCNEKIPFHTTK